MTFSSDPAYLQATIFDFQRRIGLLEEMIHGVEQQDLPTDFLLGLYMDSMCEITPTPEMGKHWVRQAYLLDTKQLLRLSRLSCDLHPWRGVLSILNRLLAAEFEPAEKAREHILSVAQDLLNLQGLELLRPQDVVGHQLPMRAAILAISK